MLVSEAQLIEFMEDAWSSFLERDLAPYEGELPPEFDEKSKVSAFIHLSGTWTGALNVVCTQKLIRPVVADLYGGDPDEVDIADVKDIMGEVANMVGGNMKSLLPMPVHLSLPTVSVGEDLGIVIPRSHPVYTLKFASAEESDPVLLFVMEADMTECKLRDDLQVPGI